MFENYRCHQMSFDFVYTRYSSVERVRSLLDNLNREPIRYVFPSTTEDPENTSRPTPSTIASNNPNYITYTYSSTPYYIPPPTPNPH